MEVVATSPQRNGRKVEVLRRPDSLFTFRIEPGPHDQAGGFYDTAERAMQEGLSSPEWLDPYGGMTVNERLFAAGLLSAFEAAIEAGDGETAVLVLQKTNLPPEAAKATVAAILGGR